MTINEIKTKVNTDKAYSFLSNNEHLRDNIILLGLGGSYAYGTNNDNSDIDIRGIATNSANEILLGKDFEQVVDTNTDTTIYSFNKMITLLTNCNPNTIEILGLRPDQYLKITSIGQELLNYREIFLSKVAVATFGGYAYSQLRRLDNKSARNLNKAEHEQHIVNSIKNAEYSFHTRYTDYPKDAINLYVDGTGEDADIYMDINLHHFPLRDYNGMLSEMHTVIRDYDKLGKRNKNAIEHNKIAKHSMHLLRLYMMCIDILEKHEINTYREKEHNLLMDIRNGKYLDENSHPTDEFMAMVEDYRIKMEEAAKVSTLPDVPNYKEIELLKARINKQIILEEI